MEPTIRLRSQGVPELTFANFLRTVRQDEADETISKADSSQANWPIWMTAYIPPLDVFQAADRSLAWASGAAPSNCPSPPRAAANSPTSLPPSAVCEQGGTFDGITTLANCACSRLPLLAHFERIRGHEPTRGRIL